MCVDFYLHYYNDIIYMNVHIDFYYNIREKFDKMFIF